MTDERLIRILEEIRPENLKSTLHINYVKKIAKIVSKSIETNSTHLFLLLDSIKSCQSASYKEDTLLEVLSFLITTSTSTSKSTTTTTNNGILDRILCSPFDKNSNNVRTQPWKELANSLASLPDLVANSNALGRFPTLNKDNYYRLVVDKIYESIEKLAINRQSSREEISLEHKLFLLQLTGRIAISGQSHLVWSRLTYRVIEANNIELKSILANIFHIATCGLKQNDKLLLSFEIFIDHLIVPVFYHLKPSKQAGPIIKSLVGADSITNNEHFKYVVCDKSILRANYSLDRHRQNVILHNIFSYLSSLVNHQGEDSSKEKTNEKDESPVGLFNSNDTSDRPNQDACDDNISILMKCLLELAHDWSNSRKILLRAYEHNRYITSALLIAFKYASEYDMSGLIRHSIKIQSIILRAIPTYLNRASGLQRNLAMCVGNLLLPKLHKLISASNKDEKEKKKSEKKANNEKTTKKHGGGYDDDDDDCLKFDAGCDDNNVDLLELKRISELDVDELFVDSNSETNIDSTPTLLSSTLQTPVEKVALENSSTTLPQTNNLCGESTMASSFKQANHPSTKQKVIVLDDDQDDDEDFEPHIDSSDEDDIEGDFDDLPVLGDEDSNQVPLYLRDCINGLIDNNNARYVKLCLIKSSEIINKMLDYERAHNEKSLDLYRQQLIDPIQGRAAAAASTKGKPVLDVNESIRDVSIELSQVLLHLDNQYNIEHFDVYRVKTLTLLAVSAPDLVVKYLFEEFNGTHKSIQLQLELLQVFVGSASYLSGNETIRDNLKLNDITTITTTTTTTATNTTTITTNMSVASKGNNKNNHKNDTKRKEKINKFSKYAASYFYGLIYRLKADFNATSEFNVISQPESIITTFRANRDSDVHGGVRSPLDDGRSLIGILKQQKQQHQRLQESVSWRSATASKQSRDILDNNRHEDGHGGAGGDERLCAESINDDNSYLLGRILFSISIIISCLDQQPITCKLSTDLLDILAAYRCHPDAGVHRAIVSCLKVMKDCTPAVYFHENLEKRVIHLFGPWLANEMSI